MSAIKKCFCIIWIIFATVLIVALPVIGRVVYMYGPACLQGSDAIDVLLPSSVMCGTALLVSIGWAVYVLIYEKE